MGRHTWNQTEQERRQKGLQKKKRKKAKREAAILAYKKTSLETEITPDSTPMSDEKNIPPPQELKALIFFTSAAAMIPTTAADPEVEVFNSTQTGLVKLVCEGAQESDGPRICSRVVPNLLSECKDLSSVAAQYCSETGAALAQTTCYNPDSNAGYRGTATLYPCLPLMGDPACAVNATKNSCYGEGGKAAQQTKGIIIMFSIVGGIGLMWMAWKGLEKIGVVPKITRCLSNCWSTLYSCRKARDGNSSLLLEEGRGSLHYSSGGGAGDPSINRYWR